MVAQIDRSPDEDDETFLTRAEKVMQLPAGNECPAGADLYAAMNERLVWDQARALAAAAIRAFDKPDPGRPGIEVLRPIVLAVSDGSEPPIEEFVDINRRSVLLARSLLREQQQAATGPDPIGEAAYRLLSRFALEILEAGDRDSD